MRLNSSRELQQNAANAAAKRADKRHLNSGV
jgi:hypothetical protein